MNHEYAFKDQTTKIRHEYYTLYVSTCNQLKTISEVTLIVCDLTRQLRAYMFICNSSNETITSYMLLKEHLQKPCMVRVVLYSL